MTRSPSPMTVTIRTENPQPDVLWNAIPDEHAVRVGRFMAAWSLIEFKLEYLIWHFIGIDKRDLRRLTARLDARPKQEVIDELLARRRPTARDAQSWAAAKKLIDDISGRRNLVAHGVWVPYPLGSTGVLQTRRGGIVKDDHGEPIEVVPARLKPITTDELDDWIAQARAAVRHLNDLIPEQSPE